jgi:hypothetical protein
MPCNEVYHGNFCIFLYVPNTEPPPPHPSLPISTAKLASDWLSVDLDEMDLCYWTSTQTGKNKKSEGPQYLNIVEPSVQADGMAGAN